MNRYSRPRITFLTVMPSPYQRQLFRALRCDGRYKIRVLYYTHSAPDRNWEIGSLSPFETVMPGKTLTWLGSSAHLNARVYKALLDDASDLFVLSDYSAPTTQIAMRVLTYLKKPWIFWGEAPGFSNRGIIGKRVRTHLQKPIRSALAVAGIGSRAVRAYRSLFPHLRVFNIPYFCDLTTYREAAAKKRDQFKSTVDVLFSGQLIERKGVDLLIEAFSRIHEETPKLRIRLLGTGPLRNKLGSMIPANCRGRIQFLGFKEPTETPSVFAASDIFVLPSRYDGWGVVVNEALGAGLPLIVSDRVGAQDLVNDGINGFIIPAGSIDPLATALLNLAKSESARQSFSSMSAQQSWNWDLDEGVKRWVDLFGFALAT